MKSYSFYQFMKTKVGESSEIGKLSEHILNDSMFPKYTQDYHTLSDYLEVTQYENVSLSSFDDAFKEYENWLNH